MIFRQKKNKKKQKIFKIIILRVDFVPQSQHPSHIIPNSPISSQTTCIIPNANVIPNLIRDLIIVPQNRSFQASLSGHPPRRHKLLLRWTALQALQSLPLHKKFYTHKNTKKTASNITTESKSFCPKQKTNFLLAC